jgi:hypothetical protein
MLNVILLIWRGSMPISVLVLSHVSNRPLTVRPGYALSLSLSLSPSLWAPPPLIIRKNRNSAHTFPYFLTCVITFLSNSLHFVCSSPLLLLGRFWSFVGAPIAQMDCSWFVNNRCSFSSWVGFVFNTCMQSVCAKCVQLCMKEEYHLFWWYVGGNCSFWCSSCLDGLEDPRSQHHEWVLKCNRNWGYRIFYCCLP